MLKFFFSEQGLPGICIRYAALWELKLGLLLWIVSNTFLLVVYSVHFPQFIVHILSYFSFGIINVFTLGFCVSFFQYFIHLIIHFLIHLSILLFVQLFNFISHLDSTVEYVEQANAPTCAILTRGFLHTGKKN